MKSFEYKIKDELGLHARPAGMLAKTAKSTGSNVTVTKEDKTVAADRLLSLMGLGIRHGDTVTVRVDGGDEESALAVLQTFFDTYL